MNSPVRSVRFYGSTEGKSDANSSPSPSNSNNSTNNNGNGNGIGNGNCDKPTLGHQLSNGLAASSAPAPEASPLISPRPTKSISSLASGISVSDSANSADSPIPQFPKRTSRPPSISHSNSTHNLSDSDDTDEDEESNSDPSRRRFDLAKSPTLFNLFTHSEEEEKLIEKSKESDELSSDSLKTANYRQRRRSFAMADDEKIPLLGHANANETHNSHGPTQTRPHSHSVAHGHRGSLVKHRSRSQSSAIPLIHSAPPVPLYQVWLASLSKFFLDLYNSELFEQLTNPFGRHRRIWLLLIFFFALYNAIVIPFRLAFRELWQEPQYYILFYVFDYIGDFVFLLDVGLNFFTPFTHEMVYERNLTQIRIHYFKTWFFPDLISSVPIDSLFIILGADWRTVLLVRFTRFLRFIKYDQYFKVWEQYATRAPQLIRFLKLSVGMLLILHWLGCMWIFCGYEYGFGTSTWMPSMEVYQSSVFSQYIFAFWWATNIVTQVGGDPGLPTTDVERGLDVFVAFLSTFVVAIVIGNVSELVSELNADENNLRQKLHNLNHFMYTRRLPEELQNRIRNYYMNLWSRQGGVDDSNIMEELPSSLRTEVSLVMNQDILGKVPIFSNSSEGFINSLVAHLKPQTYAPKEFIVRQGDIGSEMYFISRGQVNVIANEKVVGAIKEGGFFGEISVLSDQSQRTASIQAVNFVDVFVLTHADMQLMFKSFPAEKAVILRVADTRRSKDLLRKALQDDQLFVREHIKGFNCDAGFISILMDLFTPVDLFASESPLMDENGNLDLDSFGYVFGPHNPADTIYFIGKGCVNIFANKTVVHNENYSDENCDDEEEEPDFICSLKEGDFVGEIGSDFYSVWAVVPFEYRRDTIIFALSATDLQAIHDYYEKTFKDDPKMRKRIKRALICLLQRHRTAEDYRASKLPVPTKREANADADGLKKGRQSLWKSVSKAVGFGMSTLRKVSAPENSEEIQNAETPQSNTAGSGGEEFRSGNSSGMPLHNIKDENETDIESSESVILLTDNDEKVEVLSSEKPQLSLKLSLKGDETDIPVIKISQPEDQQSDSRTSLSDSEAASLPPRSYSLPVTNSNLDQIQLAQDSTPISPITTNQSSPPDHAISILGHLDVSQLQTGRSHSASLPSMQLDPQSGQQSGSPTPSSSLPPVRSGSYSQRPAPPIAAARPPVMRALSTPMSYLQPDQLSPINSNPQSPRFSPVGSPRAAAASPRGASGSALNKSVFSHFAAEQSRLELPNQQENSKIPARIRKMGSVFGGGSRDSLDSTELLKSRRQSDIMVVQRALASQPQALGGPKISLPGLQIPKNSIGSKRPSIMSPSLIAGNNSQATTQPGSPMPVLPVSPQPSGSRRGSIVSPYSFLLQLPMLNIPTGSPTNVSPQPNSAGGNQRKSGGGHNRGPSFDGSAAVNRPDFLRALSKDSVEQRKLSSSGAPQSPAFPTAAASTSRRLEFLDKALGALGPEELLILANKANLLLFNRLQQQSQQIIELSENNSAAAS